MLSRRPTCVFTSVYRQPWIARDIAWRVRYLRTKDAHKQLARTSLNKRRGRLIEKIRYSVQPVLSGH